MSRRIMLKKIDAQKERQLIRAWQENHDQKSMETLIKSYHPLLFRLIKKYQPYDNFFMRNDLIQEGVIAMMHAASRFDLEKGVRFSSYAKWWIFSALQNYVLKNSSVVTRCVSYRKLFFKLKKLQQTLRQLTMQNPQDVYHNFLKNCEEMEKQLKDLSLNTCLADMDCTTILRDETFTPEEQCLMNEKKTLQKNLLTEMIGTLNSKEKWIVNQRICDQTLSEIGSLLGITKERVRQIEQRALRKMTFCLKEKSAQKREVLA